MTYADDTVVNVAGVNVRFVAGSVYDAFSTDSTSFTVTVPAGEAFVVQAHDPRANLENDALLPICKITTSSVNQMIINGPRTVTVRPQQTNCASSGSDTANTPGFSFSSPAAGAAMTMGASTQLFWTSLGKSVASVRIRLSTDGGVTYPHVVAENAINNGFLNWTVPNVYTTAQARLKIEGFDQGSVVSMAVGPLFTINGMTPPVEPAPPVVKTYDYEPAAVTAAASSIAVDKGLSFALTVGTTCTPDTRIKAVGSDAVYYCGRDAKRYVFPNRATYDTWYAGDFAGVVELPLSVIQKIPLGGNVTYRPGTRMVKITTANEVFAVAADGTLRHVTTEAAASRLYGANWNKMIDDLPDAFFTNYRIGSPILE